MDCTLCGCPAGEVCNQATKLCVSACSDGTPYGECSSSKPLLCDDGQLIEACGTCGCPSTTPDCYPSGECRTPPTLSADVQSQYPYGRDISIPVAIQGLDQGHTVSARITTESGLQIQEITYGTWTSSNTVMFYFDPIESPGNFKFVAWASKPAPPYDTVYSSEKFFTIKAPLDVTFTVSDPNQYTVRDVDFSVTVPGPNGEIVPFNRQMSAKIDGSPINIGNVMWSDQGNGKWKATIAKEYIRPGTMEVTLTVSDQYGKYESTTKVISSITVTKPSVGVAVLAPTESKIGDTEEIKVSVSDLFGQPMDPDTIELTVTYPGGLVTKPFYLNAFQNDFRKIATGIYSVHFQFADKEGGAYEWKAAATKELYFKGASTPVLTIVSGGGITPTCDVTDQCDPDCPDDPDCQAGIQIPLWLWLVMGLAIIVIIILVFRRK